MAAENLLLDLAKCNGNKVLIHRLPGIFGANALPNYNSVVATFCYAISNDLKYEISNPQNTIQISYVMDWVKLMIDFLSGDFEENRLPVYKISLGDLCDVIVNFKLGKECHLIKIDKDLCNKLFFTYNSYN